MKRCQTKRSAQQKELKEHNKKSEWKKQEEIACKTKEERQIHKAAQQEREECVQVAQEKALVDQTGGQAGQVIIHSNKDARRQH